MHIPATSHPRPAYKAPGSLEVSDVKKASKTVVTFWSQLWPPGASTRVPRVCGHLPSGARPRGRGPFPVVNSWTQKRARQWPRPWPATSWPAFVSTKWPRNCDQTLTIRDHQSCRAQSKWNTKSNEKLKKSERPLRGQIDHDPVTTPGTPQAIFFPVPGTALCAVVGLARASGGPGVVPKS